MALRITIDLFSGRRNPVINVPEAESKKLIERLRPVRKLGKGDLAPPPDSTLGYRGLLIEQTGARVKALPKVFRLVHGDLFAPEFAWRAADEDFEDFFCGPAGPLRKLKLGKEFPGLLRKQIGRLRKIRLECPWKHPHWPRRRHCRCAPLYEPTWWNDGGQKQLNNNCYNYSTNYRTDTFAQPGQAAGAIYTALTCASVRPAAIADDLIDAPGANNRCPPEGHLVALVIAPGSDFHWYRKGRNGYWTHKPGDTPATNVDNSGHLIPDPRTADRGPYTQFCTFMVVMHGHIKIQ